MLAHIVDQLNPLLPEHLALMAAGSQVLREPWPSTAAGRTTYPAVELVGTSLVLQFSTRDGADAGAIVLEAYRVPEDPPQAVVAG